ncbi:MAG: universal stress protein [Desulfurococcales archaeon]|nr:universal stress protein [Desulfurococcales archaeon]
MTYVREPTYEVSFLFRKVLVPVDGATSSLKALDIAVDYAKRYGSKITVLIVDDGSIRNLDEVIDKVREKVRKAGILADVKTSKLDVFTNSTPSRVVQEAIDGAYDLIIISARGRSANPDINLGSVALSTVVNAPTSVLLIR